MNDFAVITCHFNPAGFKRPVANYRLFSKQLREQGCPIYTVELAFDDRPFALEDEQNCFHLRTRSILWHKESLLNYVAKQVPSQYTKLGWVDADILWSDPDWWKKASQVLEDYPVIQLFGVVSFGDGGERLSAVKGEREDSAFKGLPGYAWAARRELFETGLYDLCITGSADSAMWTAFKDDESGMWLPAAFGPFFEKYRQWREHAVKFTGGLKGVGYLDTRIRHLFHGLPENRRYCDCRDICRMLPDALDQVFSRDDNGLLQWLDLDGGPHQFMRRYFVRRRDDQAPSGVKVPVVNLR